MTVVVEGRETPHEAARKRLLAGDAGAGRCRPCTDAVAETTAHEVLGAQLARVREQTATLLTAAYGIPAVSVGVSEEKPLQTVPFVKTPVDARRAAYARQIFSLLSATGADNRPVIGGDVKTLTFEGYADDRDSLPPVLRAADAGRYWIVARGSAETYAYVWMGCYYREIRLPAPARAGELWLPPARPLERPRAWGGGIVAVPEPPAPAAPPQPRPVKALEAIEPCPSCDAIDVHWLRPSADTDPEEAEVIRECRACGGEWPEK